jgi:hypothetical protein
LSKIILKALKTVGSLRYPFGFLLIYTRSPLRVLRMPVWTLYEQSVLSNSEQSCGDESKSEIEVTGVLSGLEGQALPGINPLELPLQL